MDAPLLAKSARPYVTRLLRAIEPHAARLDRRFRSILRARGCEKAETRAFLAITPVAAAGVRPLAKFLEQVEYNGRRLAKLNIEPGEVYQALRKFDAVLGTALGVQFQPAREQLQQATAFVLRDAYYQVREAEAQAFFGLDRAEAQAAGLDDLLQRFVAILTQAFHARSGRLILGSVPLPGKLAEPLFIERGSADERLVGDPEMRGEYASYWSFPLAGCGLLQFGFPVKYPWLPRELTLLKAVAERCREAIEKARLREENGRLLIEARCAEAEERRRIGRELHDEAGQSLLVLRLQLEMLEREADVGLQPRLAEARRVTERVVEEIRRLVAALGPEVLERLGLAAALRQLAARFRKTHPATVQLRIAGSCDEIPRETSEVIYRVAQESLQNIAKHSEATHVNLLLRRADKNIRLRVADNGRGFCAETALSKATAFGVAGMRERAALMGGRLVIRSSPGKGTTVSLEVPASAGGVQDGKDSRTIDRRSHIVPAGNPDAAFSRAGYRSSGRGRGRGPGDYADSAVASGRGVDGCRHDGDE
jgi:signal transduction histidine kinase